MISEDPDYEAKKARIRELLEKPNCLVLFEDEKGPMVVKHYGGSYGKSTYVTVGY